MFWFKRQGVFLKCQSVSGKVLYNVCFFFHVQLLADDALSLIYRTYSLTTDYTDFFG